MNGRRDALAGLALMGVAAAVFRSTATLQAGAAETGLNPADYPRALAWALAGLGAVLVFQGLARRPRAPAGTPTPFFGPQILGAAVFFFFLIAYIFLLTEIGYTLSTILFLLGGALLLDDRRKQPLHWAGAAAFSIVGSVAVYWIFGVFLKAPVVEGPLDEWLRYTVFKGLGIG